MSIAEAAVPAGRAVPAPSPSTVDSALHALDGWLPGTRGPWLKALRALDLAAVPLTGRPLSSLPLQRRREVLTRLSGHVEAHWLVRLATAPLKLAQVREPGVHEAAGTRWGLQEPGHTEPARWHRQVMNAADLGGEEQLEAEVVVVGTGAGGAPLAADLAAAGHAVLLLEEGQLHERGDFTGQAAPMQRLLYRAPLPLALGRGVIPVPVGRGVGGTTTINSGTCYRPDTALFDRWRRERGLGRLGWELDEHYERVERMLGVELPEAEALGGVARVVARGAEALGWTHGPLPRNAPGCDGQGLCCFGCPTDAKRSAQVSWVPEALDAGASLLTGARVERVLVEAGRAVGVEATVGGAPLRVRAHAVVLAAGALHTPTLLLKQGLQGPSGQLGRNLTIHPASHAWAIFDEIIDGTEEIPQGWGIEEFVAEGLRFEGSTLPLELLATLAPAVGPAWTEFIEEHRHLASFGFMVSDSARGVVRVGADGNPSVRYRLADRDRRRVIRGQGLLARMFLAAGARRVLPAVRGYGPFRTLAAVERFEAEAPSRLAARHLDLSAYHPLGTARMGTRPTRSVVGLDHQAHHLPGLFVVDGSTVDGPLGVNPQLTIMALSLRAAPFVGRAVERAAAARPDPAEPCPDVSWGPGLGFTETMAGELLGGDTPRPCAFTVEAKGAPGALGELGGARGARWELEGTATVGGLVAGAAAVGSLELRPRRLREALAYHLEFNDAEGHRWVLEGAKDLRGWNPVRGMTTLPVVLRDALGQERDRGVLRFGSDELVPWLRSWWWRRGAA